MTTFTKLDNTNCVDGRITQGPGSSIPGSYNYLGNFDSYEQCSQFNNIPSSAKAITYHDNTIGGGYAKQCYSIDDNNTQVPNQNYATCGIVAPNSPKQTVASTTAPTVPTVVTDSTDELTEQVNNLKNLEHDKYFALNILLNSNPSPDNVAQQEAIINEITEISTLRSNLFDTLLNNASSNSKLNEQMNSNLENKNTIKTLKENSLNLERAALEAEDTTISNARRMVDINTYYHKQYAARVKIMKSIVLICFVIIFFIVLMHLGWLPQELVTVIVVITLLAGVIYIGYLVNDMYQRSKLNFDEYNFPFDASKFGSQLSKSKKSAKASTDQSCSLYNSIASSAATVEDSISSKATELMNEVNGGTPDPSQTSSSLTSANANTGSDSGAAATPSVQTKLSESFIPLMSRMDRRQFNSNNAQHPAAYDTENNFGKI